MKKSTAFLAALLAALQLSACGGSSQGGTDTTDTTSGTADTTADVFDGLANNTYDGREFNFLIRETEYNGYYMEEATGEVLDDAVYRRNTEVEDRFNIRINPISINASWDNRDVYLGTIRNSVMAASGEYDLVDGYAAVIGALFADNICMNLWEVPNLRLNEKWWSELSASELTVNDKLFAMTGDLAINMWSNMFAIYFNKRMIDDFKYTSPYERVLNDTWTFESFLSDIKDVGTDLDGDGSMGDNDRWGFLAYDSLALDNFHNAFNISLSKRDKDGFPVYDLQSEKLISAVEMVNALAFNNPDAHYMDQSRANKGATSRGIFTQGNTLYFVDTLTACTLMRDSDMDFGILPLPKYDEAQTGYYTTSRDGRSMFIIPNDVKDADFVGLITEALAVASYKYVIPAYYDVTLKTKAARDDESAAMLDIIREGLKLEFVAEYAIQNGGGGSAIRNYLGSSTGYASSIASSIEKYNAGLEAFMESYK